MDWTTTYAAPSTCKPRQRLQPSRLVVVFQEPPVGACDALVERGRGPPAQLVDFRDVEELAGGAVRLAAVPHDGPVVADDLCHDLSELGDRDVRPGAHVHVLVTVVVFEQEQAGGREVVDVQELAPGCA